jgi:DNA-binding transcriptional ArsR family regulator
VGKLPTLRIHFTPEDLARTRLAGRADRCWETALSLDLLRSRQASGALGRWRAWARGRLGPWAGPLLSAAPPAEDFPEFVEQLQMDGDRLLAEVLQRYQRSLLDPVWTSVSTAVGLDRNRRTRTLLAVGLEGLLATLAPRWSWQPGLLIAEHPQDRDLFLGGRGLVLTPAGFGFRQPIVRTVPDRPTELIHPIATDLRLLITPEDAEERRPGDLDALLGTTRAAALQALSVGGTTTELAQRVGISTAAASHHATVLRKAGLISTQRLGPSVLHSVTDLGSAVLGRARPDPASGSRIKPAG